MKRFLNIFILVFISYLCFGQETKSISLSFSANDFEIELNDSGRTTITSSLYNVFYEEDSLSPALPYIGINVLVAPNQHLDEWSFTKSELLVSNSVEMANNVPPIPTNMLMTTICNKLTEFSDSVYPQTSVQYIGDHTIDGYHLLSFSICPFKYNNVNKTLSLLSNINLTISLVQATSNNTYSNGENMFDLIGSLVINEDDLSLYDGGGDGDRNHHKFSVSGRDIEPYRYLVVTRDSLKSAFAELINWKTTKGVKAKVVTIEEICENYTGSDLPYKIKNALRDYYIAGGKYVLLGGDADIIPTRYCVTPISTTDTQSIPADIYYSCFDKNFAWDGNNNGIYGEFGDNIDVMPEVILSRALVSNRDEVAVFVQKVLQYEQNPSSKPFNKKILLSGVQINRKAFPNPSDAQKESERMYQKNIAPYWNGQRVRFFDTMTDLPGGANYQMSAENLQNELARGYAFVDIITHGWTEWYGWLETYPLYYNTDASTLENVGNTIITSVPCYSNAFDKVLENQTCMSKAFMCNPNSGVIAFFGSSREGWFTTSCDYNGAFYESLFTSNGKSFGESAMIAKLKNKGTKNFNIVGGVNKFLHLAINPIGDPEMPVYISNPKGLLHESVYMSEGTLNINVGNDTCNVCISKQDSIDSVYCVLRDTCGVITMNVSAGEYTVCLTKLGYRPKIYHCTNGNIVYIQNKQFTNFNEVFGNLIYVGSNVTNSQPSGPVYIESGTTNMKVRNNITINGTFEVKEGAVFSIEGEN